MTRHRMAAGDVAWLHMDRPTNRLIVESVMWFDEQLDWDAVRVLLQQRLIDRFPRFSQRVVDHGPVVWWEDDETFRLERHLRHVKLPVPGAQADLEVYMSEYAGQPLDRDLPLWELHLVDGYRGNGCAIVSRIHHCIADGVALSRVMLSLTDDPTDAAQADVAGPGESGSGVLAALGHLAGEALHPTRMAHHVLDAAAGGRALAHLATMTPDARTALRGELGQQKTLMWSEPLALRAISTSAHAAGVTVNDLLLTAVTGAVRAFLAREDGDAPDIRAVIPVNLRPQGPLPAELGNEFGLIFLQLPVSIDDPVERLVEMRRRTHALKNAAEPVVTFKLLDFTGHGPYLTQRAFVDLFAIKASAVMTNVAGPRQAVFLAGRRVRGTVGWPPESGNLGLGVSIISYDGEVAIGFMTDDRLVRDPRRILRETVAELDQLMSVQAPG